MQGTRKAFNEYATHNVTTGDGQSLSLGISDMSTGEAKSDFDCTKNLMFELANLLLPNTANQGQKDTLVGRLLVNKAYNEQLKESRVKFLPLVIEIFSELEADEVSSIISITNLFCGLYVVANLGTVAKDD